MKFLSNLRISYRLGFSYALLILLLVVIGAFGIRTANRLAGDLDRTAKSSLVKIETANALESNVNTIAWASRDLLLVDSAGQIKKRKAAIDSALQDTLKQLSSLQTAVESDKEKDLLSQIQKQQTTFIAAIEAFRKVQADGSPDDARENLLTKVVPVQQEYQKGLKAMVDLQFEDAKVLANDGEQMARSSVLVTVVLVLVAALIGGGGGLAIARSIVEPARKAQAAAESISAGDLSREIVVEGSDELSQMLVAMREMQSALTGVVKSVSSAAGEVAESSGAIAGGNSDLSDRTARSASSLQQTAASVEEIAANLNGSSELTRRAAGIATQARQAASAGGVSVQSVIETMQQIAASSQRINDIIGVIDGIAFQTNILALNAAVEAARAGEHGRGFAVVASEVRALASRAAAAAKEIKGLIQESSVKVAAGTALVNSAGQTIRGVVDEVNNMGQLIEEISHAAQEQAAGVGVVNNAMGDLDRTTQQNSALVEDLTRSTESLKASSSRLLSAVGFFRFSSHST